LNNLAWLYSERDDPRALETAERAHAVAPESGEVADTLGWLLVRKGEMTRAIPLLREAVHRAPGVAEIRYHLAVALARSGEADEARDLLRGLEAQGEDFPSRVQARALLEDL
jgi:Flp pilus assembly protein TadD